MPTKDDLKYFQSMPLDIKVAMTKTRIREWVNHFGESGVYISFSGGKDSTVLLHLVRELYPDIPAVFVNTGLEYPEIQKFVKEFENIEILRPEMSFKEVIRRYGYPFLGKDISKKIEAARRGQEWALKFINGTAKDKNGNPSQFCIEHYKPLISADFIISPKCCDVMKKAPIHKYEKETGRVAFVGTLAEESRMRESQWMLYSCNSFETKPPKSQPMSFWTENDVLQYIVENNLKIAEPYGEVIKAVKGNQLSFDEDCGYICSKLKRTGCIFCGFGAHLDEYSRFLLLKETHPKQYKFCIGGGEYDSDGLWKPNKDGLGMGHVIDVLNELYSKNGKPFIQYE